MIKEKVVGRKCDDGSKNFSILSTGLPWALIVASVMNYGPV